MKASWSNPFDEDHADYGYTHEGTHYTVLPPDSLQSAGLEEPITGMFRRELYIPGYNVDIDAIRENQLRLCPAFEKLRDESVEVFEAADSAERITSQRILTLYFLYHRPDTPSILQEFPYQKSGHVVTLLEAERKLHPLVEWLFPARAIADLPAAAQENMKKAIQIKMGLRRITDVDSISHVRHVFPEAIDAITHWVRNIEGPIANFAFAACPVSQDMNIRNAVGLFTHMAHGKPLLPQPRYN